MRRPPTILRPIAGGETKETGPEAGLARRLAEAVGVETPTARDRMNYWRIRPKSMDSVGVRT